MKVTVQQDATAVVDIATRAARNIAAGVASGIRKAAVALAQDVAAHTPRKSGKAAASVKVTAHRYIEHGQVVMHDFKDAFYSRFLLRGAKRHPIFPKYQSARGLSYARKRAEKKGLPFTITGLKKSLAFEFRGRKVFAAEVDHPGVKARDILGQRLSANRDNVISLIAASIDHELARKESGRTGVPIDTILARMRS